jgi:hypothetical protein
MPYCLDRCIGARRLDEPFVDLTLARKPQSTG